jgi:hypothetical protein
MSEITGKATAKNIHQIHAEQIASLQQRLASAEAERDVLNKRLVEAVEVSSVVAEDYRASNPASQL